MKEPKGLLLILTTALISGFSIFINQFGVKGIDPYLFTGLKNVFVVLLLFSLLLGTKEVKTLRKLSAKDWFFLSIIGFIGGGLPFLLFFQGLSLTSAAQASLIHKNLFLPVAVLAFFLLKERLNRKFLVGAFLLLAGNIFLLEKAFPLWLSLGNLLVLGATLLWAVENVISKKVLEKLSSNVVAWGRMFFGSILIFAFLGATGRLELIASLGLNAWIWIGITGLMLLGYVVSWYAGLKKVQVSMATAVLTLGSPMTTTLSFLSGKSLNMSEIVGLIIFLVGGVWVVYFSSRSKDLEIEKDYVRV